MTGREREEGKVGESQSEYLGFGGIGKHFPRKSKE